MNIPCITLEDIPNELIIYILEFLDAASYVSFLRTGVAHPYNIAQNNRKKNEHLTFVKLQRALQSFIKSGSGTLFNCKKCNSNNVTSSLIKFRAADEAATCIYRCRKCNLQWIE